MPSAVRHLQSFALVRRVVSEERDQRDRLQWNEIWMDR